MVAVAHMFPDDPREKEFVLEVLRAHPELGDFIARLDELAGAGQDAGGDGGDPD